MRRAETTLEYEMLQNLPDLTIRESNTSIVQDKIHHRRNRVLELHLQGRTNLKIAEMTGYDLSTVEKDLHAIREMARQWFEHECTTDFCQSIHDAIILCDYLIAELQILNSEETQADKKLKIISLIAEYGIKKTRLYEQTIAVQTYLRQQ